MGGIRVSQYRGNLLAYYFFQLRKSENLRVSNGIIKFSMLEVA